MSKLKEILGWTITTHFKDGTTTESKLGVPGILNTQVAKSGGGGSSSSRSNVRYRWIDADECPKHGRWTVVPAGYSKKTDRDYDAFFTCEDNCKNRPGRDWTAENDPEEYDAQTDDLEDGTDDEDPGPDDDDLPF